MDASNLNLTTFVSPHVVSARQAVWDWAAPARLRKTLTIIVPVRNEEGNLERAYEEIAAAMAPLPYDYEVLVIDNASTDLSGSLAAELCAETSAGDTFASAAISVSKRRWPPVFAWHRATQPWSCSAISKILRR